MHIAPATEADLPVLVGALGQGRFFRDRLDRQRRGLGTLLVAWRDGRPVGDVYLWTEPADEPEVRRFLPGVPQLNHLEVAPAEQGRGIGTALIRAAEELARTQGHQVMSLGVGVTNPGARRLYERLSYVDWEHGPLIASWQDEHGDTVSEEIVMLVKTLAVGVPGLDRWDAWTPRRAADLLAGCAVPWCVAAGWAIELFAGRPVRSHGDLEIAIPRADFAVLRRHLPEAELYAAGGGLTRLSPGEVPPPESHQIWVCDRAADAWRLDIFLEPGDRTTWVSHRDERIRVPLADAVAHTPDGIPYLRPEIVLFVKAKHARPKDELDWAVALPGLDERARAWLAGALDLVHPGHPWRARLTA